MNIAKRILTNLCRLLLATTFIFSGYVKLVDPLGTQYKIQDYMEALGMPGALPDWLTLGTSVALATLEFAIGTFLLFAIRRRQSSRAALAFMAVMTPITAWLFIANPVTDCGCFGDAIHLTNGQTLAKNIALLACAAVLSLWPLKMVRFVSETNQWIVINYTVLFALATSGISLWTLPLFDFRPYHIGADIRKGMEIPDGAPQPEFETTFIMQKNGIKKEFTLDNYPDSTWQFVDSKTVQTKEGYVPPIQDFTLTLAKNGRSDDGEDITEQVLGDQRPVFLLIAPFLEQADDSNFGNIDQIYEYALDKGYAFYGVTASTAAGIEHWRDITGAEYPFCTMDAITLKTIIRSNPGLVLLQKGVVVNKWSHNALPDLDTDEGKSELTPSPVPDYIQTSKRIVKIVLWFFLPLFVLTLADRTWAWTKWVRRRKRLNKIYQHFKRKSNMRKKIVAGNWKMNMNLQDGVKLAKEINEALMADKPNCEVVICTPFIHLASVAQVLDSQVVGLGAENCADKASGAYTGEVSAEMVKSTGAQYVILGHSERRQYYGETAEILKEKVQLALANGLKVIFCIGETLEEREAEQQNEVVKAELEGSVYNLSAEEWKNIILAYEPIWAIGTGKTATSEQAEEMLAYIRSTVAEKYGSEAADNTTILYGGSCKASNAPELFAKPNIDGGLIGGASLKTADFKGIIDAWKK